MRVIITRSNPVSPDPRVEKVANTLLSLGHHIKILAWNRSPEKKQKTDGEVKAKNGKIAIRWFNYKSAYGNGLKKLIPLLLFQFFLMHWLVKHRKEYEVIHACDFDTVIPAWVCSRLFRKKLVYDIFDYYVDAFHVPSILKPIVEMLDIFIINSADAVIIVSESRREQISRSRPKNLTIIHNTPDDSCVNHIDNCHWILSQYNKPKIVYIGILGEGRLLKEIVEVFQENLEWELHIGGFGPYADHIEEVAKKSENIYYYGKLPYEKVLYIEQNCDILFAVYDPSIPNHRYSSPNKLYEAMMFGKPIIVAKDTGIDKLVEAENLGVSINYSKEEFKQAVDELLRSKATWEHYSTKTRGLYEREFSWSIMRKRLQELYNKLGY